MSAFICDPEHIKALAIFAVGRQPKLGGSLNVDPRYIRRPDMPELDHYDAEAIATFYAETLWQENIRSVQTRYPDDTWDSLPGPCAKPEHLTVTTQEVLSDRCHPTPVAILKMCDCYEYQSSETDDWDRTLAHEILSLIRSAAIVALPGYDDAPWEYSGPPKITRQPTRIR